MTILTDVKEGDNLTEINHHFVILHDACLDCKPISARIIHTTTARYCYKWLSLVFPVQQSMNKLSLSKNN
jgi:hypothetical protein